MSANRLHYAFWKLTLKAPGAHGPDRHPVVSQMVLGSDRTWGNGSRGLVVGFVLAVALTACSDDSGGGSPGERGQRFFVPTRDANTTMLSE